MKLHSHTFAITLLMSALALPALAAPDSTQLMGASAPSSAARQEIRITPETKHVNVEGGDIVRFVVGHRTFAWNFDGGLNFSSFDLNKVAPPGVLDHPVTVYIAPDPQRL